MAFESIKAGIDLLVTQMENQPEDAHELLEMIHQELARLKATGQPLPDDMLELERRLETEFTRDAKPPSA